MIGRGSHTRAKRRQPSMPALQALALLLLQSAHCQPSTTHRDGVGHVQNDLQVVQRDLRGLSTPRDAFALRRAPEVIELEAHVDSLTNLGVCYHNRSILPDTPDSICKPLYCLWSAKANAYIDMWDRPLTKTSRPAEECDKPQGGQLPLTPGQRPVVSFIIPYLDNAEPTSRCLLELFRTAREAPSAEYILMSDGSTNNSLVLETVSRLQDLFDVRIVHQQSDTRMGFGPSVNKGGEVATGEYYGIINNDAYVVKGWLWALLSTFTMRNPRRAGLIGPMFMGKNNLVQEGGGWMFQDATGGNYGKGKPLSTDVNYLREVDYVSAAAILTPADLQDPFGILDNSYENGYYEDTDLAFRMNAKGHRVLFQPLSVVYHQEGTTFGTDESAWKQDLMAKNRKKFVDKWRPTLKTYHCRPNTEWATAVRRKTGPRILWVDDKIPEPDRDSGSIRTLNIMRILVEEGFDVTYQAMNVIVNRTVYYEPTLRYYGVDTPTILPPTMWALKDPWGECRFDVIVVARRGMYMAALPYLKQDCPFQPLIYDTVDLHFLREARGALTKKAVAHDAWDFGKLTAGKIYKWLNSGSTESLDVVNSREIELELMDRSDVVVVVSHVEAMIVQQYRPDAKVTILSNVHDLDDTIPPIPNDCQSRRGAMFIGSFNHPPNRQAIITFIEDMLPLVLKRLPAHYRDDFMFHVIGSDDVPKDLMSMFARNKHHVKFHGYLPEEDVQAMFYNTKVFAAPLLSGAGVKGKVNQAMKYGLPVVGTPIAFEAMFPTDGEDCMVAMSPEDYVNKFVQTYTDCALWERLVRGGFVNVRKNFGITMARERLLQTLDLVNIRPRKEEARCHPVTQESIDMTDQ